MTLSSTIALFFAMLVLAIMPGPGILVVVARTLSHGLNAGVSTTVGIVAGDIVWITLSILGLTALASSMGDWFVIVKYLGALYLIYLGISVFRKPSEKEYETAATDSTKLVASSLEHLAHFFAGLAITLTNPKAILFYVSFLPAFVDLAHVSFRDALLIYACAVVSVGSVMLCYASLAYKTQSIGARHSTDGSDTRFDGRYVVRLVSAIMLIGSGLYIGVTG
jgi:threonine/homoserine/homoserine lactone efflux protein